MNTMEREIETVEQVCTLKDERLKKEIEKSKAQSMKMLEIKEQRDGDEILVAVLEKVLFSTGRDHDTALKVVNDTLQKKLQEKEKVMQQKIKKDSLLQVELQRVEDEGRDKLALQELYFNERKEEWEKKQQKQDFTMEEISAAE